MQNNFTKFFGNRLGYYLEIPFILLQIYLSCKNSFKDGKWYSSTDIKDFEQRFNQALNVIFNEDGKGVLYDEKQVNLTLAAFQKAVNNSDLESFGTDMMRNRISSPYSYNIGPEDISSLSKLDIYNLFKGLEDVFKGSDVVIAGASELYRSNPNADYPSIFKIAFTDSWSKAQEYQVIMYVGTVICLQ